MTLITKARLVSNPFLVLCFFPYCGLFTNLKITHSQALAYPRAGRLMPRALGKRYCSSSSPWIAAKSHGTLSSLKSSQLGVCISMNRPSIARNDLSISKIQMERGRFRLWELSELGILHHFTSLCMFCEAKSFWNTDWKAILLKKKSCILQLFLPGCFIDLFAC